MCDVLKKMSDNMLKYGSIMLDISIVSNNDYFRFYTIKYADEKWLLVKLNGEWIINWHIREG